MQEQGLELPRHERLGRLAAADTSPRSTRTSTAQSVPASTRARAMRSSRERARV